MTISDFGAAGNPEMDSDFTEFYRFFTGYRDL